MTSRTRDWIGTAVACLMLAGFSFSFGWNWRSSDIPKQPQVKLGSLLVPGSVIHQICWTDDLKEQGKIDTLPIVQTGALCTYNVLQTWKAIIRLENK